MHELIKKQATLTLASIVVALNLACGCSSNSAARELGYLFIGGLVVVATLVFIIEKAKSKGRITPEPDSQLNNERGKHLNNYLEQTKGERLTAEQCQTIEENLGLYHWVPEDLKKPWEERILVFLDSFHFTNMLDGNVTEEMRLLVAAEACLLIVNRPMSDYRHLQRIRLWEHEIEGMENARGTATRHEVNLSWAYLKKTTGNARDGHNLTLHEFAHVIDFADDGVAQSIPVSRHSSDYEKWQVMVDEEHQRLMRSYESGKNYSIRAYGGYESIKGDKPELFSCATSAFFERGVRLKRECPKVYKALKKFYAIDPATWRK